MKTANIRRNQLSPETFAWYKSYLEALDAKDLNRYGSFLADNCSMQMNNAEPVRGKTEVLSSLKAFWATFGKIEHDLLNLYGSDQAFMLEALNHYERLDGSAMTLRAVALTDRDVDGRVASFRLYSDTTPLFHSA